MMIGKKLLHYEITEKLGEGGMGEVYRARDTKLPRDVAIKVLPEQLAKDPERRKRFEREARFKNFARLDEAEFQESDIHEGLDSTLTLVQHELKNRISVNKEYGDIPRIYCYPNQLNQVFMNLFVNAARAIEDQGRIQIKTSANETTVYIEIADTGRGIPSENLNRIFEPGFTTKGAGVGTGLGLSISYNIIQKHGGKIEVKSEVGKGTTFVVLLPIEGTGTEAE